MEVLDIKAGMAAEAVVAERVDPAELAPLAAKEAMADMVRRVR